MIPVPAHRLSVAPMMSYTDRHFRFMMRLFTRRTLLYTEMVVASTIIHNREGDILDRVLSFDPLEHPIAVQLGGDDPAMLTESARICEDRGFDEINLNVGCPSDRVQKGRFGACLMKEPERVASCVAAMRSAVDIPVTVKHRIGVDDLDDYQDLHRFVTIVAESGCEVFIAHARKAWLEGLSPAQNRSIPPLRYDDIYRLKADFPHLTIVINGGITNLDEVRAHLSHVDGVMIGRAAYNQPELFAAVDHEIFGEPPRPAPSTEEILAEISAYIQGEVARGARISLVAKHLVGLFKNRPGARRWRQQISRLVQGNVGDLDLVAVYRSAFGTNEPVSV